MKKMTDAIADWEAEMQKPEDKRMSLHLFAEVHNIPYTTLETHSPPMIVNASNLAAAWVQSVLSTSRRQMSLWACSSAKTALTKALAWVKPSTP